LEVLNDADASAEELVDAVFSLMEACTRVFRAQR
jgi:hypothetical protein